ncbi:hypothetical protein [Algoriphagus algorifonticola]|uniref:hypothetical protein n=1 Tax=Algoriphagus algorifonticola TaxID=2593007 RepID=UPI0011A3B6E5|nr:hypothetical protein [Algoriphagus algorifonticola]
MGQCASCPNSGSISVKSYTRLPVNGNVNNGNNAYNTASWNPSGVPGSNNIARFPNAGSYLWQVGGGSSEQLAGLILEAGVTLELGRSNNNQSVAFRIENGCITVKSSATLNLAYYTELENVAICLEPGARIIFDSNFTNPSPGNRDDISFNNVLITLADNTSILDFRNADIQIGSLGLDINGWTGNELCDGTTPPSGFQSGNIRWTSNTKNICEILGSRVLPVEFAKFDLSINNNERFAKLSWSTQKEWENSHFEIERSFNSIQEWSSVGSVSGQGYSDGEVKYEFVDWNLPVSAGNIFYRLKQIDFDGSFSYSPVKAVQIDAIPGKNPWVLYPNPSLIQEEVNIEWREPQGWKEEQIILRISNSKGFGTSLFLKNILEVQEVVKSYFNDQPAGLYLIDLSWADKNQQFKVLRK